MINPYIGHASQLYGIEEHRMTGGKGEGMRLLQVTNGKGLELTLLPDRALDISRLKYHGMNMSYFSPCGYVAPAYYESTDSNWLKSFTAGFLTTCGLQSVGSPCVDDGESLPLHGSIANTPAEHVYWLEEDQKLKIHAFIGDEVIFGRKLKMHRLIEVSLNDNQLTVTDSIENTGDRLEPLEVLYHLNMGYPLLDEDSVINIHSKKVIPRDDHAAEDLKHWMHMEKPQNGYVERCYYHEMDDWGYASIYQPKQNQGLKITYDKDQLDCFVEWKMMGFRDYVLGLECGNCYPDGRDVMREKGILKYLNPGEIKTYQFTVTMLDAQEQENEKC